LRHQFRLYDLRLMYVEHSDRMFVH
jgi:hypothetical protein